MKKIRDFFYNCNDIIAVLIILLAAVTLIYWRVNVILDYPATLAAENAIDHSDTDNEVVIEEPEMGLHPQAIKAVLLEILELIHNGLKVIVSTHSTTLLDFAWAFNIVKKSEAANKEDALYEMFDLHKNAATSQIFEGLLSKQLSTYYFSRTATGKVTSTDISSLDAGSEDSAISEWGGLSQFSSKVADIVYKYTD